MTMFTKRCSHHGPWRNGFASSIKISLMLILLSCLFISGNTYGQIASVGHKHAGAISPWDQANPQWFLGDQPGPNAGRLLNTSASNAPLPGDQAFFSTVITIDGNPSDWPAVLTDANNTKKAFKHDPFNILHVDDQWTGGSSDPDNISNWSWVNGNSNDKGDIANAGAVLIGCNLYFFGDRTATEGDAQIGFWFFLGGVGPVGDGSVASGFSGSHTNGDILIISNFTNGGGTAQPSVYEWQGKTATDSGSLVLIDSSTVDASIATNTAVYPVPTMTLGGQTWSFSPKSGTANTYPVPLFFEGRLNVCSIPGASLCFTTFLLETRNSASINASLQDLVAGGFSGVPPPPGVTNATVCVDNQPATITSTCSQGTCQWWADSTTTTPLTTGGGITVNGCSLSVSGFAPGTYPYFASCTDGGCTSARVRGTITVVGRPTVVGDVIPSEADNVPDDPDGIIPGSPGPGCPKVYQLNLLRANVVHFTASGATTLNWAIVDDGNPNDNITFVNNGATATFTINSATGLSSQYKFVVTGSNSAGCINRDTVCILPSAVLPTCNLCGPNDICASTAGDQQYCLKSLCTNANPDALDLTDFNYVWSIINKVGTGTVQFVHAGTNALVDTVQNVACVTTRVTGTVTSYTVQLNINGKGPLGINVPPCTKTTTVTCPTPTIGAAGANATIECTASPSFTPPTATDACAGATVNNLGDVTSGNSCIKTITRSWDATNACGNHSATVSQTITVQDTQAPTIGSAGSNHTIDCTASPDFTVPTASDACNGATVNLLTNTTTGNSCNKVFTRTWDATDACGHHSATRTQIITAIDTHAPTIGQAGANATIDCTTTPSFTPPTAADDCSGATVNLLSDTQTGTSCTVTVFTRTWDATDACGNHSATRTQSITVIGSQAPVIGPAGSNHTIDCTATPDFTIPTASDACGATTVNLLTNTSTGNSCNKVYTRTWDATDACGNHSATVTQVITAIDTHAPTIGQAGSNHTIDCTASPDFTVPTAADDCSGATVNLLSNTSSGNSCNKVFTRTWDATDACGNHSATRTQVITAIDTHGPTIGAAGENATIDCTATPVFTGPTAADDCSGATVNLLSNTSSGNSCSKVYTRTWDATDACGNHSATRTQVITALDTHAPTIGQAGASATVDCTTTPSFTAPTAADDCSGATVNLISDTQTGTSCTVTVFTRMWDATDACGNHSATRTQSITVIGSQAPVIGQAGSDHTIDCTATPDFTVPTASDACGATTVNLLTNTTTGNSCNRVFTRTWDATDACGNHSATRTQVITAIDTHGPTIGQAGANGTIDCTGTPNFTVPTAADDCSGATVNLLTNTTTGTSCSRVFTRTWDATDACGNHSATRTQIITAIDTHAPTIGQAGGNGTIDCTATPNFTVPTAADDCSGATVNLLTNTTTGNSCSRVFTRTWDATDACGNHSATRTQVITAVDNQGPTIGNPGASATINCPATPAFTPPTASDACSGATVHQLSDVTVTGSGGSFTETRSWDATDACGNHSATVSQTITVVCNPTTFCGFTQGFWGNKNGLAVMQDSGLLNTPIIIGSILPGKNSVLIPAGAFLKVNQVMPGGSTPGPLTVSGQCNILDACFNSYLTKQGKINNVLLGQTISLSLNVRLTNTLLNLPPIPAGQCFIIEGDTLAINQNVVNYLICTSGSATVAKVLQLANDLLGGVLVPGQLVNGCAVPSYGDVTEAVDFLNNSFDECKTFTGFGSCVPLATTRAAITQEGGLKVTPYPNPYTDQVRFVIESPISGKGTLEVYNLLGQKLQTVYQGYIFKGKNEVVQYNVPQLLRTHLVYILRVGKKEVTGKVLNIR